MFILFYPKITILFTVIKSDVFCLGEPQRAPGGGTNCERAIPRSGRVGVGVGVGVGAGRRDGGTARAERKRLDRRGDQRRARGQRGRAGSPHRGHPVRVQAQPLQERWPKELFWC